MEALTVLQRSALDETYADLAGYIADKARRFADRHGVSLQEAKADAGFHFLRAWELWRGGRRYAASFRTHVGYCVYYGMIEDARAEFGRRYQRRLRTEVTSFETCEPQAPPTTTAIDALLDATGDAATVLRLVLDAPAELAAAANGKGGSPRNWRSSLRVYLRDLGWSAARINDSFEEVREALYGQA